MTRTDVMASSRPGRTGGGHSGKGLGSLIRCTVLPIALLLALALVGPGVAAAAEPGTSGYSGYGTEPNKPAATTPAATTPATTSTPATGTSPAKETKEPTTAAKETSPAKTASSPTTSTKATTLPFTGFDLRWSLAIGLLLMGAGCSIVVVQRRQRRMNGR